MQLIFTIDEFRTLVHILREHENDEQQGQQRGAMSGILQKILERDFGFASDELEALEDLLRKESERLKNAQIPSTEPEREMFIRHRRLLDQTLDKIVEACAMF